MNVCVAHLQMNACVAKNFGAWTEKVGHPCPTFMAHPTRVGRRVGALHKKLGHPWFNLIKQLTEVSWTNIAGRFSLLLFFIRKCNEGKLEMGYEMMICSF